MWEVRGFIVWQAIRLVANRKHISLDIDYKYLHYLTINMYTLRSKHGAQIMLDDIFTC